MPKTYLRKNNKRQRFLTAKQDEQQLLAKQEETLSGKELNRALVYAEARFDRTFKPKRKR